MTSEDREFSQLHELPWLLLHDGQYFGRVEIQPTHCAYEAGLVIA
jgi:hypothetical protein